jgi:hypothetical protein
MEQVLEEKDGMPFTRDMRGKRELSGVQERSPGRIDRHRIRHVSQQQVPRPVFALHYVLQVICCVPSALHKGSTVMCRNID